MLSNPAARIDFWVPLELSAEDRQEHRRRNYSVLARLKSGVDLAEAQVALNVLAGRVLAELPQEYPADEGFEIAVVSLHDLMVAEVKPALNLIGGAAGLVLLIACANVANLMLARESAAPEGDRDAAGFGRQSPAGSASAFDRELAAGVGGRRARAGLCVVGHVGAAGR